MLGCFFPPSCPFSPSPNVLQVLLKVTLDVQKRRVACLISRLQPGLQRFMVSPARLLEKLRLKEEVKGKGGNPLPGGSPQSSGPSSAEASHHPGPAALAGMQPDYSLGGFAPEENQIC